MYKPKSNCLSDEYLIAPCVCLPVSRKTLSGVPHCAVLVLYIICRNPIQRRESVVRLISVHIARIMKKGST